MTDLEQRTLAWHNARRGKLTASNLGALLGQVSYVSRLTAYKRALGQDEFVGNIATQWGTDNENTGICAYHMLTGNLIQPTGLHTHTLYDWLAGSPDGLVGSEGMIEVKCPFYFRKDGTGRLHKDIPLHYLQQVNALLEITGRQWCDYVCWTPEGMLVYRVQRDPELFQYLLHHYSRINAAIRANLPKPPSLSAIEKAKIKQMLEDSRSKTVDYEYWSNADRNDSMPSVDMFEDSPPIKRQRIF